MTALPRVTFVVVLLWLSGFKSLTLAASWTSHKGKRDYGPVKVLALETSPVAKKRLRSQLLIPSKRIRRPSGSFDVHVHVHDFHMYT